MNRREFMIAAATAAMGGCASSDAQTANGINGQGAQSVPSGGSGTSVPPRNRHPYKDVDWATALQIRGTTHMHCRTQKELDIILKRIEFLTLSNYYPSAPWWPLSKMTENYYRVHHDFPVTVNGKRTEGPFDWNAIVGKWIKELSAELQAEYPFKEGAPLFKPLPEGVLEAPNAEHHGFKKDDGHTARGLHMNAPGSAFASGTFDQWTKRRFQTFQRGGYSIGSGEHWKTAIDRMIGGLIFPDGGGVTVNHPKWSAYDRNFMLEILDYDPRVLGIEVIEGGGSNSESYWDWVLSTGRQCFGFFVPDHSINRKDNSFGVNVLLTPERTVQACLKAYREGNFYGAKRGLNELKFKRIVFSGTTVEAETDKPARLQVITALGPVEEVKCDTSIKWSMEKPPLAGGPRKDVHMFARVKAYAVDGSGEELFSQPYMLV